MKLLCWDRGFSSPAFHLCNCRHVISAGMRLCEAIWGKDPLAGEAQGVSVRKRLIAEFFQNRRNYFLKLAHQA